MKRQAGMLVDALTRAADRHDYNPINELLEGELSFLNIGPILLVQRGYHLKYGLTYAMYETNEVSAHPRCIYGGKDDSVAILTPQEGSGEPSIRLESLV